MSQKTSQKESKTFLYKKVYQDLKDRIQNGEYLRDALLPSEREIGETYQVDRTTGPQGASSFWWMTGWLKRGPVRGPWWCGGRTRNRLSLVPCCAGAEERPHCLPSSKRG